MAEAGEQAPQPNLQDALVERNRGLSESTQKAAESILVKSGEQAAANFLTMHERINLLHEMSQIQDPKEYADYLHAMKEAVTTLVNGLSLGNGSQIRERQRKVAEDEWGSKLRDGIRTGIKEAAGSVGPRESVMASDYKL